AHGEAQRALGALVLPDLLLESPVCLAQALLAAATLTLGSLHGGPLAPERVRDEDRGAERRCDRSDVLDPEQVRDLHERRHRPDPGGCDEDDSQQLPPW